MNFYELMNKADTINFDTMKSVLWIILFLIGLWIVIGIFKDRRYR